MEKSVTIFGCGWLGESLAKYLIEHGYLVRASVRTKSACDSLRQKGIDCHIYDLRHSTLAQSLLCSQKWVFLVPFRRTLENPDLFLFGCQQFIELTSNVHPPEKFIFSSSTSVYVAKNEWIQEDSIEANMDRRSRVLREVETLFIKRFGLNATILRLGGLYGAERKNAKLENSIPKPAAPMNVIRQDFACESIVYALENQLAHKIYNIVEPHHPFRQIGTNLNNKSDLELPYKIVSGARFRYETGLSFLR